MNVKGYLFDALGIGSIILILLFFFLIFAYFGQAIETLPGNENTLNKTNQTYQQVVYTIKESQSGMRLLFILMYVSIVLASAVVDVHPAILVISGILLIFFMIVVSIFTDVFTMIEELIVSTNSPILSTHFQTIMDEFPVFSLLSGISMLAIGMFKMHRGV